MPADISEAPLRRPFDLSLCHLDLPVVEELEESWCVVRDDLITGGTKVRYLRALVHALADDPDHQEVVFAGPAQGGLPLALAVTFGERTTLWYPQRKVLAARQRETLLYEARHIYSKVPYVRPSMVKRRALAYSQEVGALCIRWSLSYPEVVNAIAQVCRKVDLAYGPFDQVWCAGGGGTLTRGLATGFPHSEVHVVGIGRNMLPFEVNPPGVNRSPVIIHPPPSYAMDAPCRTRPPFDADRFYDAKAWEYAVQWSTDSGPGEPARRLFWNVIHDVVPSLVGPNPALQIDLSHTEYR
jgi:hypothetical protein